MRSGALASVVVLAGLLTALPVWAAPLDHDAVLAAVPDVVAAGTPSFVVHAVDESGEWSAGAGLADVKRDLPADPDAAFRIGSKSKPMVAVAVLQLVDENKIGLDAPIGAYLPGLLARGDVVTIRQLLGHRSGLGPGVLFRDHGEGAIGTVDKVCHTTYDPVDPSRQAAHRARGLPRPTTTSATHNRSDGQLG